MRATLNKVFTDYSQWLSIPKKYLWDIITFPFINPTLERILTWIIAPHCYIRLFSIIVLGNNQTALNLIFKTLVLDIFGSSNTFALIASAGLSFDPIPWFVTLVALFLTMFFSAKYQRNDGRIDPNWGPLAYISRFAFVIFTLFTAPIAG